MTPHGGPCKCYGPCLAWAEAGSLRRHACSASPPRLGQLSPTDPCSGVEGTHARSPSLDGAAALLPLFALSAPRWARERTRCHLAAGCDKWPRPPRRPVMCVADAGVGGGDGGGCQAADGPRAEEVSKTPSPMLVRPAGSATVGLSSPCSAPWLLQRCLLFRASSRALAHARSVQI